MRRQESCITQGAEATLLGQLDRNTASFGEHLGQDARVVGQGHMQNLSKKTKCGDFKKQVWPLVNIQNTSALLQCTRWDTLFLSHPHPSEPKEVYQYLDASEDGRFELRVPVSGDLKENKTQAVKNHNYELRSHSNSMEKRTQWPVDIQKAGTEVSPKTSQLLQVRAVQWRLQKNIWFCYRANTKPIWTPWFQVAAHCSSVSLINMQSHFPTNAPFEAYSLLQGYRGGKVSKEITHMKCETASPSILEKHW